MATFELYGTARCPHTGEMRDWLECKRSDFVEYDVEADPAARALIADGFARWSAAIADGLRALRAAGHLPAGTSPDDLAVTLLAALQGGLFLAQVQRDTRPLETAVDTILALAAIR